MRVVGAMNHFLLPSLLTALFICGIWFFVSFLMKKKGSIILWGCRYIFVTYIVGVLMVTDAYQVFIEGIPTFFIEPNFIPFVNMINDILSNPSGMIEQIGYNLILFIPFGFLIVISFPSCKWNLRKLVIVTLIAIFAVEILETFSGRYMDIDDVLINLCGSVLGYTKINFLYPQQRHLSSCAAILKPHIRLRPAMGCIKSRDMQMPEAYPNSVFRSAKDSTR